MTIHSNITVQEIASMIDHSLLQPTMTDADLIAGFETALKWNVASVCVNGNAILKVIFENDYMPNDEYKLKLIHICREIGVAYIKTSTGYGYNKLHDGNFATKGATLSDCKLMVDNAGPKMFVKAAGGIRTLTDLLAFKEIGVKRIGATATEAILQSIPKISI